MEYKEKDREDLEKNYIPTLYAYYQTLPEKLRYNNAVIAFYLILEKKFPHLPLEDK